MSASPELWPAFPSTLGNRSRLPAAWLELKSSQCTTQAAFNNNYRLLWMPAVPEFTHDIYHQK